jgi:hypothetical protein
MVDFHYRNLNNWYPPAHCENFVTKILKDVCCFLDSRFLLEFQNMGALQDLLGFSFECFSIEVFSKILVFFLQGGTWRDPRTVVRSI